ncbi:hydrolase [Kordiimonas sediminis]|uniref:Hydrolase n=2 Tax=Kordiimonas sediminis TaxID=1735581 RepID=A0A919AKJ6_9PROT|nr:hydrolase [Kordiimonas sediminis]
MDHLELAKALSDTYHVICPDSIGCGLSSWVQDKTNDTGLQFYAEMAKSLLSQLSVSSCHWIGVSKGGGLGMMLADHRSGLNVRKLILNDVGPTLDDWVQGAVAKGVAKTPRFESYLAFEDRLRGSLQKRGLNLSDAKWRQLAQAWARRTDDGGVTFHHDPALAEQFSHHKQDFDLWDHFENIQIPTLLIKGQPSIVSDEDTARMQSSGPKCTVHDRTGGHISFMDSPEEHAIIKNFLGA